MSNDMAEQLSRINLTDVFSLQSTFPSEIESKQLPKAFVKTPSGIVFQKNLMWQKNLHKPCTKRILCFKIRVKILERIDV